MGPEDNPDTAGREGVCLAILAFLEAGAILEVAATSPLVQSYLVGSSLVFVTEEMTVEENEMRTWTVSNPFNSILTESK